MPRDLSRDVRYVLGEPLALVLLAVGFLGSALTFGPALVQAWGRGDVLAVPFYVLLFLLTLPLFALLAFMGAVIVLFAGRLVLAIRRLHERRCELRAWREQFAGPADEVDEDDEGMARPATPQLPDELVRAYRVLGLSPGADKTAIRRAYRRLALELHPDRSGDARGFLRLQEAYERVSAG